MLTDLSIIQTSHKRQTDRAARDMRRIQRHLAIETSSVADSEYTVICYGRIMKHGITQWLESTEEEVHEGTHEANPGVATGETGALENLQALSEEHGSSETTRPLDTGMINRSETGNVRRVASAAVTRYIWQAQNNARHSMPSSNVEGPDASTAVSDLVHRGSEMQYSTTPSAQPGPTPTAPASALTEHDAYANLSPPPYSLETYTNPPSNEIQPTSTPVHPIQTMTSHHRPGILSELAGKTFGRDARQKDQRVYGYRVKAMYSYIVHSDDPNDVSLKKHEIMEASDTSARWW